MRNESYVKFNGLWKKYKKKGQYVSYELLIDRIAKLLKRDRDEYHWALKNINLEVRKGEILGIIGRNGAGKTTLLKCVSGMTYPTLGTVEVCGKVATFLDIGSGFHGELTGKENILFYASLIGIDRKIIKNKIDEIIDFSGLSDYIDVPVKFYSNGMWVRLALSVAFFADADILLLDEVFAMGDIHFQEQSIKRMREILEKKNKLIFFVSHNTTLIRKVCTRVILIDNGEILCEGEPEYVISEYMKRFFSQGVIRKEYEVPSDRNPAFIKEIYLDNEKDTIITKVDTTIKIGIRIAVVSKAGIRIAVFISSKDMENIIETESGEIQLTHIGEYEIKIALPVGFLNSGVWRIGVHVYTTYPYPKTILYEPYTLAFNVVSELDMSSTLSRKMNAPILLPFNYEINKIENERT